MATFPLSMRRGALVMKSVSLFLAGTRNKSHQPPKVTNSRNRMVEKDSAFKASMKILEAAKRDTLFTRGEIEALYKIYRKLLTTNKIQGKNTQISNAPVIGKPTTVEEGIDRVVFREILHNTFDIVTEKVIMDRIFCIWDKSNSGLITLGSWLYGLSIFLKGSFLRQVEYAFSVYDLNADGFITKEEMFQLMKNCLIKHPQEEDPDESVKDLVDIILKKMDKDKDGKISLQDFQMTVIEQPLLMEAFGKCLPSEHSKNTFLSTLNV